jgi:hypothetical protein
MPYIEPLTFLAVRMGFAAVIMTTIALCVACCGDFAALHESAVGTKRTFRSRSAMSAFGGKADISGRRPTSAFDPKRTLADAARKACPLVLACYSEPVRCLALSFGEGNPQHPTPGVTLLDRQLQAEALREAQAQAAPSKTEKLLEVAQAVMKQQTEIMIFLAGQKNEQQQLCPALGAGIR